MTAAKAEASVLMANATGLHARPAVKLTRLARTFQSRVEIRPVGRADWVDAKSIVKVMALKILCDTPLAIRAEGDDAEPAVAALVAFVERNFDDGAPVVLAAS